MWCNGMTKKISYSEKETSVQRKHLNSLIEAIDSCGVSFSVWEKRNADGKGSGTCDWTNLMGDDRNILLRELPKMMESLIQQDTAKTVVELWKVLSTVNINKQGKLYFLMWTIVIHPAAYIFESLFSGLTQH